MEQRMGYNLDGGNNLPPLMTGLEIDKKIKTESKEEIVEKDEEGNDKEMICKKIPEIGPSAKERLHLEVILGKKYWCVDPGQTVEAWKKYWKELDEESEEEKRTKYMRGNYN